MTKIRKNLKIGTELTYGKHPGRTAGFTDNVTVKRILRKGDHVEGFGTMKQDGYLVSGTRVQLFKDNVGRPESTTYVINMGEDLPNLRIYLESAEPETMELLDPSTGGIIKGTIKARTEINDEASLLMVHLKVPVNIGIGQYAKDPRYDLVAHADVEYDIAVVHYNDGDNFTTSDWQGYQPETPEDIDKFQWVHNWWNFPAVVIDGLPRRFPE